MTKRSGEGGQCFIASWDYFVSRDQALTRSDRISSELASCGNVVASSEGLSNGEEKNCQEEGYKEKSQ